MDAVLSDTVGWGMLVGIALPWLTAVVQQPSWTGRRKRVVAVAASVVGGVVVSLADGVLTPDSVGAQTVLQTIAAVLIASQATYATLLYPTAKKIERDVLNRSGKAATG